MSHPTTTPAPLPRLAGRLGGLMAWLVVLAVVTPGGLAPVTAAHASDAPLVEQAPDARSVATRLWGPLRFEPMLQLRVRPELVVGGDLGWRSTNTAGPTVPAPRTVDDSSDSMLAWASLTFRLGGSLHVGDVWGVHVAVDVLDNLVLGTAHPLAGGDFTEGLWRDALGSQGAGALGDEFRLRYAYASWRVFEVLDVQGGRMVDHFGLGLVRNDGSCADCDFPSVVDGVRVGFEYAGLRVEGTYEFTANGATQSRPGFEGQPKDLGQADDVHTYTVRLSSAPAGPDGEEPFTVALDEDGGEARFRFGAFAGFIDQDLDSSRQTDDAGACPPEGLIAATPTGLCVRDDEFLELTPRSLFLVKPSLWFETDVDLASGLELRVALELAGAIGDVSNVQGSGVASGEDGEAEQVPRNFLAFGGVLRASLGQGGVHGGVEAGFATGDDRRYLGYLDGQNVLTRDSSDFENDDNVSGNRDITSFWSHRDHRIDMLLFRQLIGGVTNAIYVKPWVEGLLVDRGDLRLKARLDVLYAAAAVPSGTPGGGGSYGVEVDAGVHLETDHGIGLGLTAGVLVPMDALRDPETGLDPEGPVLGARAILTVGF